MNEGVSSPEEFREWIVKRGDSFRHNISNPQNGDILVFGWIKDKGEWIFVGDSIVKQNHKIGSVDWCNCAGEDSETYKRHIITGSGRAYPTPVGSKSVPDVELGSFAQITPENYHKIISQSVAHWKEDKVEDKEI